MSEGYGGAASGQLMSVGGGVFDEFGRPVNLNAFGLAIASGRNGAGEALGGVNDGVGGAGMIGDGKDRR